MVCYAVDSELVWIMPRYLDPKADIVFKKIFGEHPHLLRNFLNAILPLSPDKQIVELEYLSAKQAPQIPTFKRSIVDVKCKDVEGRIFIVEMQMEWTLGFMQRLLFNTAHAYVKQLYKAEDYRSICPVYGIGLVNDIFERRTLDWYHHYKIVNAQNPKRQLEGLELVFLELPKFKPSNQKEKRLRMLWIRFLSEIGEKTKQVDQDLLAIPEIKEACALCEEAGYSETELEVYCKYWDEVRTSRTLLNGNWEEGRAEGIIEGEAKGRIAITKHLLAYGFAMEGIANVTGFSLEEIKQIQESADAIASLD